MTFMEAVSSALRNTRVYTGRSGRAEYWYWYLFLVIANLIMSIPLVMFAMVFTDPSYMTPVYLAQFVIDVFLFLVTLSVTARRLHDTNLSGWYLLFFLIPFVGWIIQLIMMIQPGTPGNNRYGV